MVECKVAIKDKNQKKLNTKRQKHQRSVWVFNKLLSFFRLVTSFRIRKADVVAATKPFDEDNGEDMMQMEKINGEDMMQMEKMFSGYLLFIVLKKTKNQAALVVLGGPRDFPSLRVSNLLVAPGRETWVEVHKIKSDTKAIKMKLWTLSWPI